MSPLPSVVFVDENRFATTSRFFIFARLVRSVVSDGDPVELGVQLLARLEQAELTIAEAVDRIETITRDPALTREILDTAERRGIIEREAGLIRPQHGTFLRFEADVVSREGEFSCRRCGAALSTGYFVQFEAGDLGPFGSTCIRKVVGRE